MSKREYLRAQEAETRRSERAQQSGKPQTGDSAPDAQQEKGPILSMPFPPEEPLPASPLHLHRLVGPLWLAWAGALLWKSFSVVSLTLLIANAWLGWWVWSTLRDNAAERRWAREAGRAHSARGGSKDGPALGDGLLESAGQSLLVCSARPR